MKPAVKKKVRDIKNRVRDLKASFLVELKSKDEEKRLIPRVSAIVFREGSWLVKLAKRLATKPGVKPEKGDDDSVVSAELFFDEMSEAHADDVERNLFVYRVDAEFITHLEKMVVLVERLDAMVTLAVKSVDDEALDDDEVSEAIAADMGV